MWSFRRFFTLIFYFFPTHFFNTQHHVEENLDLKRRLLHHIALESIGRQGYFTPIVAIRHQLVNDFAIKITICFAFSLDFVD